MKIFTTIASALLLALAGCTSNTKSYDVCSFGATGDGTTEVSDLLIYSFLE